MKLPNGKYYIGDPSYVIPDDEWLPFVDNQDFGGEGQWKHVPLFAAGTAFGDGVYKGSDGVDYGVDAGLIGAIPIELCDPLSLKDGTFKVIDAIDLECTEKDGVFKFIFKTPETVEGVACLMRKSIVIDTYGSDEEE